MISNVMSLVPKTTEVSEFILRNQVRLQNSRFFSQNQ